MTDDEIQYEALRHFMMNAGCPARGGRYLLSFEKEMKITVPPKDDNDAIFRRHATSQYYAIMNPSSLATNEQIEFCRQTRKEMEKWRAMYDAGWKTSVEEGYDAFDPKLRPVDWDGKANPYPFGTFDHEEWDEGYGNAIMNADTELADAYKEMEDEDLAEEERRARESSLDSFFSHIESRANSKENKFLALTAINSQMSLLSCFLLTVDFEVGQLLPDDLRTRLVDIINHLAHESKNRDVERIGSVEDHLGDFKQLIVDLKILGTEIASRKIATPYGVITDDLYHFWHVFHGERYRQFKQAEKREMGKNDADQSRRK